MISGQNSTSQKVSEPSCHLDIVENWLQFKVDKVELSRGGFWVPTAIASSEDAVALAIHAKQLMRQYRSAARRTHVILCAPTVFALFLGQQLNAMGEIIGYEFTQDRRYLPAIVLQT